jgi:hypothetical protein
MAPSHHIMVASLGSYHPTFFKKLLYYYWHNGTLTQELHDVLTLSLD